MVTKDLIHHIVNYPGGAGCYVFRPIPFRIPQLVKIVTKRECGKSSSPGSSRHCRQFSHEIFVRGAVAFVAVEISKRHMIRERGGERVLPVKARNRRVLRVRWLFRRDSSGKLCRNV